MVFSELAFKTRKAQNILIPDLIFKTRKAQNILIPYLIFKTRKAQNILIPSVRLSVCLSVLPEAIETKLW